MKTFWIVLLLFLLMLALIAFNALYINRMSFALEDRISALPEVTDEGCVAAVRSLMDYWCAQELWVELSAGYPTVDRITELLEVLLSYALCRDPGAYLATRALLLDAIEDMRRPESFSLLSR